MARMIPDELPRGHVTEGERSLFRHLRHLLPDEFLVFFEPALPGKEPRSSRQPDFIVFGPDFGLLVIEVKDWSLSQIEQADQHSLTLKYRSQDAQPTVMENPLRKARAYCYQVLKQFTSYPILIQQGGPHRGKVCFPYGWAVAFTNIERHELTKAKELNLLFPPEYTLCRDELAELWRVREDRRTISRLAEFLCRFPFDPMTDAQTQQVEYVLRTPWSISGMANWFKGTSPRPTDPLAKSAPPQGAASQKAAKPDVGEKIVGSPLTNDQVQTVRGVLHPESVIRKRAATAASVPTGWPLPKGSQVLEVLTAEQEQQARAIGPGHRIFFGVAGSGKTILLLARAKWLASIHPHARLLLLCYNNTLLSFLRHGLQGYPSITVETFVTWALKRYALPQGESNWSESTITRAVEAQQPTVSDQYDAILIDEGHDFQPAWFRATVGALRGSSDGDLLIAVDGSQSIYGRPKTFTWKSVNVSAQGRSRRLPNNYRNTKEIFEFAWKLTQPPIEPDSEAEINDTHVRVLPATLHRTGGLPQMVDCSEFGGQTQAIAAVISRWKNMGLRDGEMAIITKSPQAMATSVMPLRRLLQTQGHSVAFAIPRSKSKKRTIVQKGAVPILSFASSKGLEFTAVLVLGLEAYEPGNTDAIQPNELYVGLTRAVNELVIAWDKPCWLSAALRTADYSSLIQGFPVTG